MNCRAVSVGLVIVLCALSGCVEEALPDPDRQDAILQPDMDRPDPEPEPNPDPDPNPAPNPDPNPDPDPTPEPEAVLLLEGKVLAPEGVLDPGQVLVVGDTIVCVAADCSAEPEAVEAEFIDTGGVISPGLIDGHNHLPYNFLPEWVSDQFFGNRYEWSDDPSYEAHISPYSDNRSANSHFCPAARWAELRSLMHGTTTIQGQSFSRTCISGWVRNADHDHHLQHDHMRTTIGSVRDINDEAAQGYIESFEDPNEPTTRFAVHMGEGVSGDHVDEEFESFVGRDPRENRHAGLSLMVPGTSIFIHSVAVTDAQLVEMAEANAKIVWSPSSNLVLYGETADIGRILDLGIKTGLSPDWTVSGEDNMLAEMRFAIGYADQVQIAAVNPRKLWEMATSEGADVVGLEGFIGRLEPGQRADIVVFADKGGDPFDVLVESRSKDIALVLIDGQGYYGDEALSAATARHGECDRVDVCGVSKYLCVKEPSVVNEWSDQSLEDIRAELTGILDGYGRADELLDLVDCLE